MSTSHADTFPGTIFGNLRSDEPIRGYDPATTRFAEHHVSSHPSLPGASFLVASRCGAQSAVRLLPRAPPNLPTLKCGKPGAVLTETRA
jgi:hypothetical protein